MKDERVMPKKAIIDRTKGTEDLKDVTQTRVVSLVKTLSTIEKLLGKDLTLEEGPKTIVITTKAREDIAGVTKETDAMIGDISEDMVQRKLVY